MHESHAGKAKDDEASFGQCCQHGKVVLPALKPTPPVLRSLICKQRPGFHAFLKNIRSYNCAFQMASSGEMCLHTVSCYQNTFVGIGFGACIMSAATASTKRFKAVFVSLSDFGMGGWDLF